MSDARELLERLMEEHASVCGACDAGLPMGCVCSADPRRGVVDLGVALRAVLELHRTADGGDLWCVECGEDTPCPTVAAISDALGGDSHG